MTSVRFLVGFEIDPDADDLEYVEAEQILADPGHYRELLEATELGFEPGAITITGEGGEATLRDALAFLVLGLCFQSVTPIAAGDEYIYQYFDDAATSAQLLPVGGDVYVSGKYVTPIVCPRHELMAQLYECGMRYLDFLKRIDVDGRAEVRHLHDAAASARVALDGLDA